MRLLVLGGTRFLGRHVATAALDRGHDVVLACHTEEQAHAIAETGRNPRYLERVGFSDTG